MYSAAFVELLVKWLHASYFSQLHGRSICIYLLWTITFQIELEMFFPWITLCCPVLLDTVCYPYWQGVLIGNHLPTQDLQDVVLYCRFHCLFTTSDQQRLAQLVIWREVSNEIICAHCPCFIYLTKLVALCMCMQHDLIRIDEMNLLILCSI